MSDLKQTITELRANLAFFGCDTSDMTDDEIIEGAQALGDVVAQAGIPAQDAADAFISLFADGVIE